MNFKKILLPKGRAAQPAAHPPAWPCPLPDVAIHRRKCSICRHPQVLEIEQDFIDWVSSRDIARAYKLPAHSTVLHHAHAMGLLDGRRENLRRSLDYIIEHASEVEPNAADIISAIRLSADLDAESGGLGRGGGVEKRPRRLAFASEDEAGS